MIQSGGFLGRLLSALIPLGLTAAAWATDAGTLKKNIRIRPL